MKRTTTARNGEGVPGREHLGKIMIINPERVAYAGLLGSPAVRELGTYTVYASLGSPLRLSRRGGDWESVDAAVVEPYVPHQVSSDERIIGALMIEPESVELGHLGRLMQAPRGRVDNEAISRRVRDAFLRLLRGDFGADLRGIDIDLLFLGEAIPRRRLDPRIASIVERIRNQPCGQFPAEECARLSGLSFSRFLHLFKSEVDTTFRRFRAWKRARSFLAYVAGEPNLTDVALEIGYPDSTHFSHSIRHVYGLRPKDIFAGSRRLSVVLQPDGRSPARPLA